MVVIGGGITGLAAAHRLVELRKSGQANVRLHLFEASAELGGSLKTRMEHGCLMEAGPDSMITDKPWGVDLIKRLGMEDRIVGTDPANRKSFVAAQGRLIPVPEGFYLMAPMKWRPWMTTPILSWSGKMRALWERWTPARRGDADESVGAFVRRRFGEEVFTRLAEPMLGGIYAADANELSIRATFPRFVEMERQYGSVLKGLSKSMAAKSDQAASGPRYGLFVALKGGMASLVDGVVKSLPRGAVRTRAGVESLERLPDGQWRVVTREGQSVTAKSVILALPSYAAAKLVQRYDPYLAQDMEGIAYGSSATINLVYRRREIPHALNGFGFVVPATERKPIVGCTFSSVKFPHRAPQGWAVLRAFLGGPFFDGASQMENHELTDLVAKELKTLLGIERVPSYVWINRHGKSLPHFHIGHVERVRRIQEGISRLKGVTLAGNAYGGIGIPDCVHSGELAAESVTNFSSKK